MRDAFEHQTRNIGEAEPTIERWLAKQYAPLCAQSAQALQTALDQGTTYALALKLGQNGNWPKAIPTMRTVGDSYRGERNMAYDMASVFRDQRNR